MNNSPVKAEMTGSRAVVILSGGLDSTTVLANALSAGLEVRTLTFDYGQRHRREIECARKVVDYYRGIGAPVEFEFVDLTGLKLSSRLTDEKSEIPQEHYTHENQKLTVVPNRNAIMLSMAVGVAISHGAKAVFFGAHANDHAIYPDCRPEFVRAFERMVRIANDQRDFAVIAPYLNKKKSDIVKEGLELKVPYYLTHTCYEGGAVACGKCASCQERILAFFDNGATDQINYALPWPDAVQLVLAKNNPPQETANV